MGWGTVDGKICGAYLNISNHLTAKEMERVADVLSAVAADFRKGEDKVGKYIEIWVEAESV